MEHTEVSMVDGLFELPPEELPVGRPGSLDVGCIEQMPDHVPVASHTT